MVEIAGAHHAAHVTGATRFDALPGVPAVAETVPGFEVTTWLGVGAPKAAPTRIVEQLNREINAGLGDPKIKARLAGLGGVPLVAPPAQRVKLVATETERWGRAVKFSGAKLD